MSESSPDTSRLVSWVSRNSGTIVFVLLLTVAMIEGVAMFAAKRQAAAKSAAGTEAPR